MVLYLERPFYFCAMTVVSRCDILELARTEILLSGSESVK